MADIDNNGKIDASTEVLQKPNYYPFGMAWESSAVDPDPAHRYLYNGKELDTDFGLNWYHYGARMYDPAVGRFTGVDPISDRFAWVSTYNYAENEPIANIDLHGLQKAKPNPAKNVNHEWQPDEADQLARSRYPTQNNIYADPSRVNFSNPNEVTQFEADKRIVRRNRVWKWFEIAIEAAGSLSLVSDIGSLFTVGRRARNLKSLDNVLGLEVLDGAGLAALKGGARLRKGKIGEFRYGHPIQDIEKSHTYIYDVKPLSDEELIKTFEPGNSKWGTITIKRGVTR